MRRLLVVVLALMGVGLQPGPAAAAPAHDDFANAREITVLPFGERSSNRGAGWEDTEPDPSCGWDADASVWYRFTPTQDVDILVTTIGSRVDTILAAYTGDTLETLREVGCNDDWQSLQSRLDTTVLAGETVHFQVSGYAGEEGMIEFEVSEVERPANDSFENAIETGEVPFSHEVDTEFATLQQGEPQPTCAPISGTVWYRFEAAGTGLATVNLSGSNYDTVVAVYRGSDMADLQEVACNDDAVPNGWSIGLSRSLAVVVPVVEDETYFVQAGAYGWDGWFQGLLSIEMDGVML